MFQAKLLIIEDDPILANTMQDILAMDKSKNYQITVANCGIVGLEKSITHKPDLVILDLHLPGLHGYEVLKGLYSELPMTKVLMVSALAGQKDIIKALDKGGDDFLIKPFGMEELNARVGSLLRRGKIIDDENLIFGDLLLNCQTRHLIRAGMVHKLSDRKFTLLAYLMRRPDEVISRDDLLKYVWEDKDCYPNTVDSYIEKLRQIIDKPYGSKYIVTAYRQGYYFDPKGCN